MDLALLRRRAFEAGYRMLGTHSDAEDIAQETLLRVRDPITLGEVANPEAYVTTVATRLAIDHLRSARVRRESYHGPWLPEPIIEHGAEGDAEIADSVSYALLVVLETLAPLERAAFLLREVFGFSYAEVGVALERSEQTTRKLVSRARRRVAERRPRLTVDPAEHRTLLERFIAAARGGDLDELLRLLSDDAVLVTDGGPRARAARRPIHGAVRVARFVRKVVPKWGSDIAPATINGGAGFVVERDRRLHAAGTIDVAGGHVTAIHWILNPEKLPARQHADRAHRDGSRSPAADGAHGIEAVNRGPGRAGDDGAARPQLRQDPVVPDPPTAGPAELDPMAYLADSDAELRRCAAQHWWAQGTDQHGQPMPVVLAWEANRETLSDRRLSPRSFVDDMTASGLSPATAAQVAPLFSRHGAEHRHLRAVLSRAFTPRKVEQLRPAARSIAERLADAIEAAGGVCEFVAAFAEPLPPEVFAILFGLPVEDRDRMARWASAIARAFTLQMGPEDLEVVEAAATEMRAYGHERIAASRAAPGDDLVTRLVEAEVDGQRLSDDDVIAMITGFVFAGAETTRRQLTAAVAVLAEHPASWQRLADDPGLLSTAVDEILRFRPIVPGVTRRAEAPFAREDLAVEPGGRVLLSFTTANRDPARFERPDELEIDRGDAHAHVTFGWGPHLCVGAGLARLEMAEALGALTARFAPPVVEESGPVAFGAPDWLRVRFPTRR